MEFVKFKEKVLPVILESGMMHHISRNDYGANIQDSKDVSNDIRLMSSFCYLNVYQYEEEPASLYIAFISVLPEYRGKGYGDKMLNLAIEIAKSLECEYVILSADTTTFKADWYKRRGFEYHSEYEEGSAFHWLILDI